MSAPAPPRATLALTSDGLVDMVGPVDGVDLSTLAPVRLEELTRNASLQTRVDRKYVLPSVEAAALVAALGDTARALEIDAARSFRYESVYFDTPGLTSYRQAAHQRPIRFKVRIRTYLDPGDSWLEVKTRDRRGRTVKHRRPHDPSERSTVGRAGLDFVEAVLRASGVGVPDLTTLAPTLITTYRRSTLYLPAEASRLTLDTGLCCGHDAESRLLRGRTVVESKSARHATSVDRLLRARGHRPVPLSKYGAGLAALRPDLPATRWRPVLRRHPFVHQPHHLTPWSHT